MSHEYDDGSEDWGESLWRDFKRRVAETHRLRAALEHIAAGQVIGRPINFARAILDGASVDEAHGRGDR